jgi:hypothetical protein
MAVTRSPSGIAVRVDPSLAEMAVFRALARLDPRRSDAHAAHRRRADDAYAIADPGERDAAFVRLAVREFEELRLAEPILVALAERPAVADAVRIVLVGEAAGRLDEGVTCEAGGAHLGLRVDAARFGDPADLLGWSRHVLGHAEDTLDPAFGFEPGWEEHAGGSIAVATRARLHRLWDVTVDARLGRAGLLPDTATRDRHRDRIAADLPGVGDAVIDRVVRRLWDGPRPSFPELLAWAARPSDLVRGGGTDEAGSLRPDRCPLCRFPGDDVVPPEPAIAALVAADYPGWSASDGLCGRCTDRYRLTRRLGGRA